jgi:hypothetical protein
MAFKNLDKAYRQRIGYDQLYMTTSSFGRAYLGYGVNETFGTQEPRRITRVMLLFGYFDKNPQMQCQPWTAMSVGLRIPFHANAHYELVKKHETTKQLSFDGSDTEISGHFWDLYLGMDNSSKPVSYTAYVGLAMHQDKFHQEKLAAVAAATGPDQVLADHTICAKFDALDGQTVRIENGNTHMLQTTQQRTN